MRSISNSASLNQAVNSSFTTMSSYQTLNNPQKLDWENLRKQARQLENEIDSKLVAFSKLSGNYSSAGVRNQTYLSDSATTSATNSSDLLFATLSNEIEEALKKLTLVNSKMNDCLSNEPNANSTVHTLQRHRDILRDYTHEYEKTKRNIISIKEREKLLSNNSNPSNQRSVLNESNLNNRRMDGNSNSTSLYMKEYDHLKNSHNLIDQQIELAEMTKENLQSQKQSLRLIQQKMNSIAHKFPMINNLMQKIKFKKRKDSIILACVISLCIILMLLYIF